MWVRGCGCGFVGALLTNVLQRVDRARHVDHVVILEAAHHLKGRERAASSRRWSPALPGAHGGLPALRRAWWLLWGQRGRLQRGRSTQVTATSQHRLPTRPAVHTSLPPSTSLMKEPAAAWQLLCEAQPPPPHLGPHLTNGVSFPNVGQELVAQALSLACTAHQAGNVHKLHGGGHLGDRGAGGGGGAGGGRRVLGAGAGSDAARSAPGEQLLPPSSWPPSCCCACCMRLHCVASAMPARTVCLLLVMVDSWSRRESGTVTMPTFGSMVQKGKLAASALPFSTMALNSVDCGGSHSAPAGSAMARGGPRGALGGSGWRAGPRPPLSPAPHGR